MAKEINRETPIPLYYQVSQILWREIQSGVYQPGDFIPTEKELQQRFQVSRATIRQAIAELMYSGVLERHRSKGTMVTKSPFEVTLRELGSFTNEFLSQNQPLVTRILTFDFIPAPAQVAGILEVETGEKLVVMERLRSVNGDPVCVEKWYTIARNFPGINRSMFSDRGWEQSTYYVLMKNYGLKIIRAYDTVGAVALQPREAKLLKRETGTPALLRTRISYSAENRPVIYGSGVYVIRLNFTLETSQH